MQAQSDPTRAASHTSPLLAGADPNRPLDLILVNAPLRDYTERPRVNDFTLPVLGMAYIATYAKHEGFNVAVLDAEALGLGIAETIAAVNTAAPHWVGFNLLAPTVTMTARIAAELDPTIHVLIGGHQAKAMPTQTLMHPAFANAKALILGEGETRTAALLGDVAARSRLHGVMWREPDGTIRTGQTDGPKEHLTAPDIDKLPFVDRIFLADDPFLAEDGRIEANMVGARGCPYDCSFCGAAVSANPDITIRTRKPANVITEMTLLREQHGVSAYRFVDDLFLGHKRVIDQFMGAFAADRIGDWAVWDATGRINILDRLDDTHLETLKANGLREVALGIESGSERVLRYIDKRTTPEMAKRVVARLLDHGINVKGYFILGFPTETRNEMAQTMALVRELWDLTEGASARFRSSVFEFRPYPGTPEWHRLMMTGRYRPAQLLDYTAVDLTADGAEESMRERDEFNFSVGIQFGEPAVQEVRAALAALTREQFQRRLAAA